MRTAASFALPVFVLSGMLDAGLGLTPGEVFAPLRRARAVAAALVANFVLVPLVAFGLARALRLHPSLAAGLLILGLSAGAPFLPLLAQLCRGSVAYAAGLMALLMVLSVAALPLALPPLLPGAAVDPARIARSLLLLMLLPLAAAMVLRAGAPALAARAKRLCGAISRLSLVLLMAALIATNAGPVLSLYGSRGVLASLLFVAAGFGCGWLVGGPDAASRRVLALGTAARNFAAALVVARSLGDPMVELLIVVVALASLLALVPGARLLGGPAPASPARSLPADDGPAPPRRTGST